jgi:hypothetical protein
MEDDLFWLNKTIPVSDDRLLPAIWSVAIAPDVLVEEMGGYRSGDDLGLVIAEAGILLKSVSVYCSVWRLCNTTIATHPGE